MIKAILWGFAISVSVSTGLLVALMGMDPGEALECGVLGTGCALGGLMAVGMLAQSDSKKKPSNEA